MALWDKENTLCCLQLKALVPMTGSRTLPIYCNIEIVNISIMLECLSMCFFSSIFFPNLIRFTNKITMLGVHYCGGGLWINIFIFRKGTLANQLNIDDGSKYKSYGIPREDRRRSTFQPIPSVGDFLWCIVIIEGSGPGRGQGDLNLLEGEEQKTEAVTVNSKRKSGYPSMHRHKRVRKEVEEDKGSDSRSVLNLSMRSCWYSMTEGWRRQRNLQRLGQSNGGLDAAIVDWKMKH